MQAGLYTIIFVCIGYCHNNVIFSLLFVVVLRQVENLEEHIFINLKFSWSLLDFEKQIVVWSYNTLVVPTNTNVKNYVFFWAVSLRDTDCITDFNSIRLFSLLHKWKIEGR
jgi:hypothetical protein